MDKTKKKQSPLRKKSPERSPPKTKNFKPLLDPKNLEKGKRSVTQISNPSAQSLKDQILSKEPLPKLKSNFIIPSKYNERMTYINEMFSNEDLSYYIESSPSTETSTLKDIAKYFMTKTGSTQEYIACIVRYMFKTIKLDTNSFSSKKGQIPPQTAENVLKNKVGFPEGICNLFKEFCTIAGFKVEIINGLLKKKKYKSGDSIFKHVWCVIYVGKNFYFVDPTLLLGYINDENKFISELRLFYFLTPPEFLIETHRPEENKWQCRNTIINIKQFTMRVPFDYVDFYSLIYKYKINLLTHMYPEFECKNSEIEIKIEVNDSDLKMEASTNGKVLDEKTARCFYDNKQRIYVANIEFPSNGDYIVTFSGKVATDTELTSVPFLKYKIKVNILNQKKKPINPNFKPYIPSQPRQTSADAIDFVGRRADKRMSKSASDFDKKMKQKCYDNKGAHLYEPKTHFLKIGQETKFKVKIKGAKNVFVLDGRKWNYLRKREEDLYEGTIVPMNQNIVLCSLKENNIYTEVYEFFAAKR